MMRKKLSIIDENDEDKMTSQTLLLKIQVNHPLLSHLLEVQQILQAHRTTLIISQLEKQQQDEELKAGEEVSSSSDDEMPKNKVRQTQLKRGGKKIKITENVNRDTQSLSDEEEVINQEEDSQDDQNQIDLDSLVDQLDAMYAIVSENKWPICSKFFELC